MDRTVLWFKALVWGNIVVGLLGGVLSALTTPLEEGTDPTDAELLLMLVVLVAIIINYVGLLKFRSWSRPMAVVLTVVTMAFTFMLGTEVMHGWSALLYDLGWMIWGALLAVIHFGDIRHRFQRASGSGPRALS
ncbi:MAG: hypothetical protein IPJ76_09660 [Flavobacteriales bacterium]|nr:MAG: hypothetical protein IPJ76_09660 [Flavobacteriales bacterium]